MGPLIRAVAGGVTAGINISSKVATLVDCPAAQKFAVSTIARFLPKDTGDAIIEIVDIIHDLFPQDLNLVDVNTALSVLAILQAKRTDRESEIKPFRPAEDTPIVKELAYYFKYAVAAYGKAKEIDIASLKCSSDKEWIKKCLPDRKIHQYIDKDQVKGKHMLEHFVAVDDKEKSVVLALKGTLSIEGALKDVRCKYNKVDAFGGQYEVHGGMWESALELVQFPPLRSQIKQELKDNPGYKLVVVGHSLGGGVASLVSTQLAEISADGQYVTNNEIFPGRPIICYGFETAPGFDQELAEKTKPFMYTIVNRNDIVPSLTYGALLDFKAIAMMLKKDSAYLSGIINDLVANTLDANKHLEYFRSLANNMKLLPSGRVWAMEMNSIGKMEIGEVKEVKERFGEPRFLQGMIFHHFPVNITKSLDSLTCLQ